MIGAPHGTTRPRHATFGAAAASGWWRCLSRLGLRPWCCRSARHPSASGGSPWRRSSAPVVDLTGSSRRFAMPRASWRGFLRLSLVSCPIYLSPATTRAKSIRLHQVWQPAPIDVAEDALSDRGEGQQGSAPSAPRLLADDSSPDEDKSLAATRVTLRPHDPATGEEIDKRQVVKGYESARGEFVTFTAEELKALDVESSKVIDLEKFVPRNEIDRLFRQLVLSPFAGAAQE